MNLKLRVIAVIISRHSPGPDETMLQAGLSCGLPVGHRSLVVFALRFIYSRILLDWVCFGN